MSYGEKHIKQRQERNQSCLPIDRGQRQEPSQKPATPRGSQLRFGCAYPTGSGQTRPVALEGRRAPRPVAAVTSLRLRLELSGEERKEELAHLPINDAFALQEEEADGYFCCVEPEMKDLKGRLVIKGDESK